MTFDVLLISIVIGAICRCIIFKKRDTKWWLALVPIVSKYKFGELSNSKRLGILNAVASPIFNSLFIFCFGFELWMIQNYSAYIQVPTNIELDSQIIISAPEYISNIAIYSKYVLIAAGIFNWVVWCMMTWKFTMIHKKSPWWILLWATATPIPYIYFAATPSVVINGKLYTTQRVEVETKNEKSARTSRNSRPRKR